MYHCRAGERGVDKFVYKINFIEKILHKPLLMIEIKKLYKLLTVFDWFMA